LWGTKENFISMLNNYVLMALREMVITGFLLLGSAGYASASAINKVGESSYVPNIGHAQSIETYEITIGIGDTVHSIAKDFARLGLQHEGVCQPYPVTPEDIVRQNPQLKDNIRLKPGQKLNYDRVSNTFPGFHLVL
jgi:hypothetical protein